MADAALQAGNSEHMIKRHYLDLVSMKDADRFWRIAPKETQLPLLKKIREQGRFILPGERHRYEAD